MTFYDNISVSLLTLDSTLSKIYLATTYNLVTENEKFSLKQIKIPCVCV